MQARVVFTNPLSEHALMKVGLQFSGMLLFVTGGT